MFGSKRKKPTTYITIYYGKERKKEEFERGQIPIRESVILAKSILFFDDPEPCYIHRGAVIMRINEEIMDELGSCREDKIEAVRVSKQVMEYIDLQDIESFQIYNK